MRKKIEWKWEKLDEFTFRAKVIGGWLVHTQATEKGRMSCCMSFVQDKDHEWIITPPIEKAPL
jgi:hypothetical protein